MRLLFFYRVFYLAIAAISAASTATATISTTSWATATTAPDEAGLHGRLRHHAADRLSEVAMRTLRSSRSYSFTVRIFAIEVRLSLHLQ